MAYLCTKINLTKIFNENYLKEKETNSAHTSHSVFDDAKLVNFMIIGLTGQNLSDQTT